MARKPRAVQGELQTSDFQPLSTPFDRGQIHPAIGMTGQKLSDLLKNTDTQYLNEMVSFASDMEDRDAHLAAELSKRRRSILTLSYDIVPPSRFKEKKYARIADFVKEALQEIKNFDDTIFDLSDGILKPFSALELEWDNSPSETIIQETHFRPQYFFMTGKSTEREEIRLVKEGYIDGEPLWKDGWVIHRHKSKSGYLTSNGLWRPLAWPFLFKHLALADFSTFLERFGLPVIIGKYGSNSTEQQKQALFDAVRTLSRNARGILPQGMSIELESAIQGQADPFRAMIEWAESTTSKIILGGTLTSTQGAVGSQALGTVHENAMWDIVRSDAIQIANTITRQIIFPLVKYNFGITDPRYCPRFLFNTTWEEDMVKMASSLEPLVRVGVDIPKTWPNEKLNIPVPAEGEDVLDIVGVYRNRKDNASADQTISANKNAFSSLDQKKADQANQGETGNKSKIEALRAEQPPEESDSELDALALFLAGRLEPIIAERVAEIVTMASNAPDMEILRQQIKSLSTQRAPLAVQSAIRNAITSASLLGSMQYQLDNSPNDWALDNAPFMEDDSLAYWEDAGYQRDDSTDSLLGAELAAAIVLAKILDLELLRAAIDSLDSASSLGLTPQQLAPLLTTSLEKAGFVGKNPYRLALTYRTALQQSYQYGGWSRIQSQASTAPYLRYTAVLDDRTRPEHRLWHGTTLPINHRWWSTHYPPNGWNCRCRVVQMSQSTMVENGWSLTPEESIDYDVSKIDEGFRYNTGTSRQINLDNLYLSKLNSFLSS